MSRRSEKSLCRRGVNDNDERGEWTLKICVSVCMSASSKQTLSISREQKLSGLPSNYDYQPSFVCEPAVAAPQFGS